MKHLRFLLTVLLLNCFVGHVYSLEVNRKMGKPTTEELNMTTYSPDPEAKAVVLYHETNAQYDYNANIGDFRIVYDVKVRIKVLAPEGVEAGNVSIEYIDPEDNNNSSENVRGLKVTTYNVENGKTVSTKMSSDLQNKERIDRSYCQIKFAAPNVKVGSVIEYEYRLQSDFYFNPKTWYAQCDYPVFYTKYKITVPDWFLFNCYPGGICHLTSTKDLDNFSSVVPGSSMPLTTPANAHIFEGRELPALESKDYIYCLKDYSTRVEHELRRIQIPGSLYKEYNTSWTSLAYSLYKDEDFGARYKMSNPLKEQQKALNLSEETPIMERVEALRNLLWENYKWNGSYSIWGTSSRSIRNDKDHELNMGSFDFTMMAMLRDANINAYPVVMSRRSMGFLPFYPSSRYFNAMVLRVNTSDSTCIYFDPTAKGYPIGVLPDDLMAKKGIVIYTDRAQMVDLSKVSEGKDIISVTASLGEDGHLKGHADIRYSQQSAGMFRDAYRSAKDSAEFAQKRATDDAVEISDYKVKDADSNLEHVTESIDFEQELQVAGDRIYINPFLFVEAKSPFTAESRILPVEWATVYSKRVNVNITLPEGYEIEEMPKSKNLSFEDGGITARIKVLSGGDKLGISYQFARQLLIANSNQYEGLRSFYGALESATQEMIILKKKQ